MSAIGALALNHHRRLSHLTDSTGASSSEARKRGVPNHVKGRFLDVSFPQVEATAAHVRTSTLPKVDALLVTLRIAVIVLTTLYVYGRLTDRPSKISS